MDEVSEGDPEADEIAVPAEEIVQNVVQEPDPGTTEMTREHDGLPESNDKQDRPNKEAKGETEPEPKGKVRLAIDPSWEEGLNLDEDVGALRPESAGSLSEDEPHRVASEEGDDEMGEVHEGIDAADNGRENSPTFQDKIARPEGAQMNLDGGTNTERAGTESNAEEREEEMVHESSGVTADTQPEVGNQELPSQTAEARTQLMQDGGQIMPSQAAETGIQPMQEGDRMMPSDATEKRMQPMLDGGEEGLSQAQSEEKHTSAVASNETQVGEQVMQDADATALGEEERVGENAADVQSLQDEETESGGSEGGTTDDDLPLGAEAYDFMQTERATRELLELEDMERGAAVHEVVSGSNPDAQDSIAVPGEARETPDLVVARRQEEGQDASRKRERSKSPNSSSDNEVEKKRQKDREEILTKAEQEAGLEGSGRESMQDDTDKALEDLEERARRGRDRWSHSIGRETRESSPRRESEVRSQGEAGDASWRERE